MQPMICAEKNTAAMPGQEAALAIDRLYGKNARTAMPVGDDLPPPDEKGCVITPFKVFDGITLLYHDIHTDHLDYGGEAQSFPPDMISIQHCREGRFEGEYANGEFFYLGEGDLAINLPETSPAAHSFPLAHYHGINLVISVGPAQAVLDGLRAVLGELAIDLAGIRARLQAGNSLVILRRDPAVEHILSELYQAQFRMQPSYLKLKVLELLLYLSGVDVQSTAMRPYFYKSQVQAVKAMQQLMTADLETHFTLEELAGRFQIPLTAMKNCFKGVYGMPIKAYMRRYRLQAAAELLRGTGLPAAEIGARVGYESPSKFTEAFKKELGRTPTEYRKIACPAGTAPARPE